MASAGLKVAVAFGPLIRFNVRATAVDREEKFAYNQHHLVDGGRLRMALPVCEACGKLVEKEETVRGYKGAYPIDEEYLDSLEKEKSSVMELDALVPASQIRPLWYKRTYYVVPEPGAEQPYVLFVKLLERADRTAIGKVVLGGKEAIVAAYAQDGMLVMSLMWWPSEVKAADDARAAIAGVEVSDAMLKVGDQLVTMMARDFAPEQYRNDYAIAVGEYLTALQEGTAPMPIVHRQAPTVAASLEDALAATLAQMQGAVAEKVAVKTGKKKVA